MNFRGKSARALIGLSLVASIAAVAPGSSSATSPPGPSYQCTTAAKPTGTNPLRVMLAGDSITSGSSGDYTWRYWLWQDIVPRHGSVNFVGDFDDIIDSVTEVRGGHQYLDCNFDQQEEARGGARLYSSNPDRPSYTRPFSSPDPTQPNYPADTNTSWIRGAVAKYKPHVIVANVGALDLTFPTTSGSDAQVAAEAIKFLKTFINQARLGNSGVDIVITTVPADVPGSTRASRYNALLPGVVSSKSTSASRLTIAKLPSWSHHTWDGAHPDAIGEVGIAAAVNDSLHRLFPTLVPAKPTTLQKPRIGPRRPASLQAQVSGNNHAKLDWTLPVGGDRTVVYARNVYGNGPWVRQADLTMYALHYYFPKVGTAQCGNTPCTTFTVTGLSGGTTYQFRVQVGKGLAIASDIVSNVPSVQATGPIGRVVPTTPVPGVRSVSVRWPNLAGAPGYDVRWRKAGAASWAGTTTASGSPRVISGLVAGQRYGFEIRAQGTLFSAPGAWSVEVFGVPKAP